MINLNSMESDKIELMDQYFDSRVDVYDEIHQQTGISWGKQIRDIVSKYISSKKCKILDLGCGTGLELEEILKKSPESEIICVDLSSEMLKKLEIKYKNYNIKTINKNFFDVELGNDEYDYVISVMALHHFFEKEKLLLYKRIFSSLKVNGLFINSDYIIDDLKYELEQFEQLRKIQNEFPDQLFHFDIPFTEDRERKVIKESGFSCVEKVYENKKTKVLVCKK
jgi:ubiquinone/menaquinone biosynthesis C-methylase UbiE